MQSTKNLRHKPQSEGIYLADTEDLDPEIAQLYLYKGLVLHINYFNVFRIKYKVSLNVLRLKAV